jgi:hypothetical protein
MEQAAPITKKDKTPQKDKDPKKDKTPKKRTGTSNGEAPPPTKKKARKSPSPCEKERAPELEPHVLASQWSCVLGASVDNGGEYYASACLI